MRPSWLIPGWNLIPVSSRDEISYLFTWCWCHMTLFYCNYKWRHSTNWKLTSNFHDTNTMHHLILSSASTFLFRCLFGFVCTWISPRLIPFPPWQDQTAEEHTGWKDRQSTEDRSNPVVQTRNRKQSIEEHDDRQQLTKQCFFQVFLFCLNFDTWRDTFEFSNFTVTS